MKEKIRKPFRHTGFFKVLKASVPVLNKIPFGVGELANNLLTKNKTEEGTMNREQLVHSVVKIAIYAVIAWAFLSGKITFDQATDAKDLLTN